VKDRLDTSAESKTANVVVWEPEQGDHLWVFPESEDKLGSGGEFHIYVDPITQPEALASFARFSLGVGGDLAEHKHNRSQELAYLISGEGTVKGRQDGVLVETPINAGSVWYIPPGAWHAVKNTGTSPLVMVFATVPNVEKGLLSFFRRIATIPGQKPTVLSREELARIGAEHDFVLKAASTNA
jgi:quercetin dioxygenase-like cupin family protein